jgi:hypothetical protein
VRLVNKTVVKLLIFGGTSVLLSTEAEICP